MSNSENIYFLSKKALVFLYTYYTVIIAIGLSVSIVLTCLLLDCTSKNKILIYTFGVAISLSGMLCSVQYIKRLYKSSINGRIKEELQQNRFIVMGNLAYFIFRPLFAIAFSVFIVFGVLSGMFIVTGSLDYVLNDKFYYCNAVISGMVGYSIGKVIDKFEKISNEKINKIGE